MSEAIANLTPKLEYLIQYPVKRVLAKKDGGFAIEFENGALLTDEREESRELPEIAEKASLLTIVLGADETRCLFGESYIDPVSQLPQVRNETWVSLKPGDYTLTDPRFPAYAAHRPQMNDDEETAEDRQKSIREQFNALAAGTDGTEPVEDAEPPSEG